MLVDVTWSGTFSNPSLFSLFLIPTKYSQCFISSTNDLLCWSMSQNLGRFLLKSRHRRQLTGQEVDLRSPSLILDFPLLPTTGPNSIFAFRLLSVALKYRGSTGGSGISLNQIQLNRQLTGQEVDFRFSFFSVLPSATRTQQEGREFYVHVILMLKTIDMILSH